MKNTFRTKFIVFTTVSVVVGVLLSLFVAILGIANLSNESSTKIAEGLSKENKEYLENYIELTSHRVDLMTKQVLADLSVMTDITQEIIDNEKEFKPILKKIANTPYFKDEFTYNKSGNWYQNEANEPTAVGVWGNLLDKRKKIKKEVKEHIDKTVLLDLFMPIIKRHNSEKEWLYIVGPEHKSYVRCFPNVDIASEYDRLYPGHNEKEFWHFFFPGYLETWREWVTNPEIKKALGTEIAVTPPYEDAAGGGLIITFFRPLWDKTRQEFEGAVGLDFGLKHVTDFIKDVKLAQTGFAFITRANGNVLGIGKAGEKILGLQEEKRVISEETTTVDKEKSEGVSVLDRILKYSTIPAFANLKLPTDDRVHYMEVGTSPNDPKKGFVVALKRMKSLNYFTDAGIKPEHWTLGFVVPKKEIFASLYTIQDEIADKTSIILMSQIAIGVAMLLIIFLGVVRLSANMTKGIVALSQGAEQIRNKNYDVQIEVKSTDEIGQLSQTFNAMTDEIRQYTRNLEGLVHERTLELEQANTKITKLNESLKDENLRLATEVEVAQRLQTMVLPRNTEWEIIKDLDIAAYMQPADEVGGDYYDVLLNDDGYKVKIGIGDVTGHGLESGVIMLMVQTAVRTLMVSGQRDPKTFYHIINKVMYQNIVRANIDKNMTLSLLDYDFQNNTLYVTGQHEDVIVIRADGHVESFSTKDLGLPIGIDEDIFDFIGKIEVHLQTDDVLLLHTDGITEAENLNNEQYGMERFINIAGTVHMQSAEEIKQAIINDVINYIGEQKIFDDISLIVIKKLDCTEQC